MLYPGSPSNSRIFWEMKIRELQNHEFRGPMYLALYVPKNLSIPLYYANCPLFGIICLASQWKEPFYKLSIFKKGEDLWQIWRNFMVLKKCKLQNRKLKNRRLRGLPVIILNSIYFHLKHLHPQCLLFQNQV